jgi:hypothetical protein
MRGLVNIEIITIAIMCVVARLSANSVLVKRVKTCRCFSVQRKFHRELCRSPKPALAVVLWVLGL